MRSEVSTDKLLCHCEGFQRGPRHALRVGERRSRHTRSRHTNRICLPSTARDDDVAIPQIDKRAFVIADLLLANRFRLCYTDFIPHIER